MTTNDGVSWINKCQGLDTLIVGIFDLHLNNNYLYAAARVFCGQGDYGRSVWKRLFAEAINIKKIVNEIPSTIKIHQNYPNPFNPVTHIRIEFPSTEMTLLKVFDISGKEIATLINERLNAGIYETLFEGTSLPSGVYFYKFSVGNFTETKKMILVK